MPNVHIFKVVGVHPEDGFITVEWDAIEGRRITCPIPTDDAGAPLTGTLFASAILGMCKDRLAHWDKLATADLSAAEGLVGQEFDVTDEYVLGGL